MITASLQYEISIILTIYNSKNYYRRAMASIFNQSYNNYELIIVDDGSEDGIEQELFPVLKTNANIIYLRHKNKGNPLSLNTGIKLSSGRFISFIDSDDEYKHNFLLNRINYFIQNPDTDLIHSPAELVGNEKDFYVPDLKDVTKLIHIDECIIGGTFFGKRNVFEELNGFKNIYSHDSEFYERATKRFIVNKLDLKDYIYYRNNFQSITNKLRNKVINDQ